MGFLEINNQVPFLRWQIFFHRCKSWIFWCCICVVCQHLALQMVLIKTAGMTTCQISHYFISTLISNYTRRFFNNDRMCLDSKLLLLLPKQDDGIKASSPTEAEKTPKKIPKTSFIIVIIIYLIAIFLSRQEFRQNTKTQQHQKPTSRQQKTFIFLRWIGCIVIFQ